jgi:hypothetical protein
MGPLRQEEGPGDATWADAIPQPANSLRFGVAKRIRYPAYLR